MDENSTVLVYGLGNEGLALLTIFAISSSVTHIPGEVRGWNRSDTRVTPLQTAARKHAKVARHTYQGNSGLSYLEFNPDILKQIFMTPAFENGHLREIKDMYMPSSGDRVKVPMTSHLVTSLFDKAMSGRDEKNPALPDLVLVCTTADAHSTYAQNLAKYINEHPELVTQRDKPIITLLSPGRCFGALDAIINFYSVLDEGLEEVCRERVIFGESASSPFASRIPEEDPLLVTVLGGKKINRFATIPESTTKDTAREIGTVLPQYTDVRLQNDRGETDRDVRYSTADSTMGGFLHHFLVSTLCATRLGEEGLMYYTDLPKNPIVANAIRQADVERVEILRTGLGIENPRTAVRVMHDMYPATEGYDDIVDAITNNPAYVGIATPPGIKTRYLEEEGPFTLVPLEGLAEGHGVDARWVTWTLNTAKMITGNNYRGSGRTLERLCIAGKSPEEITHILKTGEIDIKKN
jgi:opine dehydrogenase